MYPLVDAICGQLLEAMIEDTVGKMKIQQRSQSQSVSGGISGLPVDSGPLPVPGIIPPTSPTISNETPSSVPCTSPKSRAKVDMMQTAFDISSESSEEGMYILDAVGLSGILKGKQKLSLAFDSNKLGSIDFTNFSQLTMCST